MLTQCCARDPRRLCRCQERGERGRYQPDRMEHCPGWSAASARATLVISSLFAWLGGKVTALIIMSLEHSLAYGKYSIISIRHDTGEGMMGLWRANNTLL